MLPLLFAAACLGTPQDTVTLSLNEAVDRALAVSPDVLAAEGAVQAPRGERAENVWPFPSNPELEYGRVRRTAPGRNSLDRGWTLTQEVEIAGQGFVRASAADKRIRAAEARTRDTRRIVSLEARKAFATLAIEERRAALTDSAAAFAERLGTFARRQLEAGETNRLVYNAAVLEAARQRSVADRTYADLIAARAELGRILALADTAVPRTLPLPELPATSLDSTDAVRVARLHRSDVAAAELERRAAGQEVTASRLGLVPNLVLGGELGREAGTDDLLGFSVSVRVPLFHRQQGPTGAAHARAAAARAIQSATERRMLAEVQASVERFRRAVEAEARFADEVLRAARDNVTLTDRAFTEGKVDITDVVVLRRAAVDAQLEYLTVRSDAYTAWFELAAAMGVEPEEIPDSNGGAR